MGSTENGFSPFDIYYNYVSQNDVVEDFMPFNASTYRCSDHPPVSLSLRKVMLTYDCITQVINSLFIAFQGIQPYLCLRGLQ